LDNISGPGASAARFSYLAERHKALTESVRMLLQSKRENGRHSKAQLTIHERSFGE
jgi:hypothetical protein